MKKPARRRAKKPRISAEALRRFAENRRIANNAVQEAIEENRRLGIRDEEMFAR